MKLNPAQLTDENKPGRARQDTPVDDRDTNNLMNFSFVYLVVFVNELAGNFLSKYLAENRVTARSGGLSLFHLGRHFSGPHAAARRTPSDRASRRFNHETQKPHIFVHSFVNRRKLCAVVCRRFFLSNIYISTVGKVQSPDSSHIEQPVAQLRGKFEYTRSSKT